MQEIIKPLQCGAVLHGKEHTYLIDSPLGQGAFGITYLATTKMSGSLGSLNIKVAVKEFFMKEVNGRDGTTVTASSEDGLFVDYKNKFKTEAQNLAKLKHGNIINVLEYFEANNTIYYVMEYIDGGNLDDYIQSHGVLPEDTTVEYLRQIGSSLQFMHENNVLHLDLKPANIMRRKDNTLVLIDFGLSKQFDENGDPESSTTIGGGTPGYAPIEQATYNRGEGLPVTMDVYALGATAFKMLTGKRVPNASDILNNGFPRTQLESRSISKNLIDLIAKAMAPLKKDRFQSVSEVLANINDNTLSCNDTQCDKPLKDDDTVVKNNHSKGDSGLKTDRCKEVITKESEEKGTAGNKKTNHKILLLLCLLFVITLVGVGGVFIGVKYFNGEQTTTSQDVDEANNPRQQLSSQTYTANGVSFEMMKVEGGTFTMGATSEMKDPYDDEKPTHQVTLSSYSIGQTEVTQALWKAVMGNNPSYFKGDNLPVECVSWDDCQTFISKLNSLTGKNFRLPTEAEWEFAARGGNNSEHTQYSGSSNLDAVAWYTNNSGSKTHPVATKQANELGIYDMSGNVWEWCSDWCGNYSSSSQTNPTGSNSGAYRVCRGGSWDYYAGSCRSSNRFDCTPGSRYDFLGLRVCLSE